MAALIRCILSKNLVVCSLAAPKILPFGSHCSANFQPIFDCFISNFKLKCEDSENLEADGVRKYNCFQLTSNQTSGVFSGFFGDIRYYSKSAEKLV